MKEDSAKKTLNKFNETRFSLKNISFSLFYVINKIENIEISKKTASDRGKDGICNF